MLGGLLFDVICFTVISDFSEFIESVVVAVVLFGPKSLLRVRITEIDGLFESN